MTRGLVVLLAFVTLPALSCATRPAGVVRLANGDLDSALLDPVQTSARAAGGQALGCDEELVILGGGGETFLAEGCGGTVAVSCDGTICTTSSDPLTGRADSVGPLVRARAAGIAACTGGVGTSIVVVWSSTGELDVVFPTEPSDPLIRDCVRAQIRPYRAPDVTAAGSVRLSTDAL